MGKRYWLKNWYRPTPTKQGIEQGQNLKKVMSKINDASFINLANELVGTGLLNTGNKNYELAKLFAEQEAIGFFKWYGVKMATFIEYITKIKPLVESYEIEEKIKEFEGKPVSTLYQLYLKSKEK